ncbi:hypothetical protein [Crocosphaera sp.]|uniref:pentapeptide repeat-containing protein n=1 Tax=Crocosphaera sp. TaxID=2729996 RepID=UPI003F25DC2B|nr:hypothetical protein [Crocosphaera sp.]
MNKIQLAYKKLTSVILMTLLSSLEMMRTAPVTRAEFEMRTAPVTREEFYYPQFSVPHSIKALPGQPCLVLDNNKDTPDAIQEEYIEAEKSWTSTEHWVWSKICRGEEANLNNYSEFTCEPEQGASVSGEKNKENEKNKKIFSWIFLDNMIYVIKQKLTKDKEDSIKKQQALIKQNEASEGTANGSEKSKLETMKKELEDMKDDLTNIEDNVKKLKEKLASVKGNKNEVSADHKEELVSITGKIQEKVEEVKKLRNNNYNDLISKYEDKFKNIEECQSLTYSGGTKKISAKFLKTVLLRDPFKGALPKRITIKEAIITGNVDFSSQIIDKQLNLEDSRFEEEVKFFNTIFLHPLYLDGSTFNKPLRLSNARIQGSLNIRGATFYYILDGNKDDDNKDDEDKDEYNRALDLKRITIDGDLNLGAIKSFDKEKQGTVFKCENGLDSPPETNDAPQYYHIVSLQLAKIKHSLDLRKLTIDKGKCQNGEKHQFFAGRSEIGDAVIISEKTNIDKINFKNSQINTILFVIKGPGKDYPQLSEKPTDLFKDKNSLSEKPIVNLLMKNIHLTNAKIKRFEVFPRFHDEESEKKEGEIKCDLKLNSLVFDSVNNEGFIFLLTCLKLLYQDAINSENQDTQKNGENKDTQSEKLLALLQPLEHSANVATSLGRYRIANELLYRRKEVEKRIVCSPSREDSQDLEVIFNCLTLKVSKWFYGFGYYRMRAFWWGFRFFGLGLIIAFHEISKKQKDRVDSYLESRSSLNKDKFKQNVKLEDLLSERYSIEKIIVVAHDLDEEDHNKDMIYLVIQIANQKPKKVQITLKTLHQLIYTLEQINSKYTQVGFYEREQLFLINPNNQNNYGNFQDENAIISAIPYTYGLTTLNVNEIQSDRVNFLDLRLNLKLVRMFMIINQSDWLDNIKKSFIYNIDAMLPVVELDKELQKLVLEDSEGFPIYYFQFQQLISKIILVILLPIIFF